jgi:O-succinylbenzoic acid--CoA ligase
MSRFVPDALVIRAARRPHEPAIRGDGVAWSRRQLLAAADALAAALAGEGIEAGHRVASLQADAVPAVVLIEALRRLGAVLIPLNRRAAAAELRYQLEAAAPRVLVHDGECSDFAAESAPAAVPRQRIEALMAAAPSVDSAGLLDEMDLDASAAIVFTSGTSGRPKGAVLTHGNLAASAHAWSAVLRPRSSDRWLACLPLHHVAGLAVVTRALRWGVELEIQSTFEPDAVSRSLEAGASHVSLVPVQLAALLEARAKRAVPASLRAILLGGGPIPADLLERAIAGGYPVLTTYGLTETGSGIAVGGVDEATRRDRSAARALPGVRLRIEPDGSADGSGEILVQGEMVFAGYLDDAVARADKLADGWLHTGDVGTLDASGLLRVSGRRDELIISGGENVAPAAVEAVLLAHPAVAEAAVGGIPDSRWGAVPAAVVVLRPGAAVTDEQLLRHCRARLAAYQVPVRIVRLPALPRNAMGKLVRGDLLELLG